MLPDLVSALRCIKPHEDSWLVAATYRLEGRHIAEGVLGCPVCHAEYPVRGGIADFTGGAAAGDDDGDGCIAASVEEAVRLAALLDLAEPRSPVLLGGAWGALLPLLRDAVPATWLLVNAVPPAGEPTASALRAAGALPFATGGAHGVALDATTARDAGIMMGAVRALRPRGRLVAPVTAPVPGGMRELARDGRHWVAERVPEPEVTAPQPLLRRR
ncbi:MAG TPA: hypothetical protein VGE02_08415 [Gemmatimonadales bacterium]